MTAPTLPRLAPRCADRAARMAAQADRAGITPTAWPAGYADADRRDAAARRLAWSAYAAGEYPRAALADAADVAALRPDVAAEVWHAAACATILASPGCDCPLTPAAARDALVDMARDVAAPQAR